MKISEIMDGVSIISAKCDMDAEITDICFDSRKAGKGCAFVAIKGFKTDGHDYIEKAIGSGADLIVSEKPIKADVHHIVVEDSRRALAQMSGNFFGHPSKDFTLIGVTGTNGKTTTTYLIKTILEQTVGAKVGLIGTNQNLIGDKVLETSRTTPESYEVQKLFYDMKQEGCTHVVMEVSSHALCLDRVYGCDFDAGVFTNLTQDHLDFHNTMEEYLKAKAILFDMCKVGIINIDDPASEYILKNTSCEKRTYSARNDDADIVAKNINLKADKVEFEAVIYRDIARMTLGIPGMFSVYNALAAISLSLSLGISLSEISEAIKKAHGVRGRIEVVPTPTDYTVLIDYAHSPDGIENVLTAVRGFAKGRVISLFGCGGDRDRTKRPKMGAMAAKHSDFCIVTSDNPRTEVPEKIIEDILPGVKQESCPYVVVADRREAIRYALQNAKADDVIVLMGKGHEDYQEINGVKHHLDEREEIAKFFAENKG